MAANNPESKPLTDDTIDQYISSLKALGTKFGKIASCESEVAGNLERAAAALRSMTKGAPSQQKS